MTGPDACGIKYLTETHNHKGVDVGQIIFHCSNCGAKLAAQLDEIGQEFECPQCKHSQIVPGKPSGGPAQQTAPGTAATPKKSEVSTAPVIRIPKRKIVLSAAADEEEDRYEEEEIGGTGVGLFAVALGTAGLILCAISMVWMLITQKEAQVPWSVSLIVFLSTFLMGLMGLVISQLARLVVRLADRISRISNEE